MAGSSSSSSFVLVLESPQRIEDGGENEDEEEANSALCNRLFRSGNLRNSHGYKLSSKKSHSQALNRL